MSQYIVGGSKDLVAVSEGVDRAIEALQKLEDVQRAKRAELDEYGHMDELHERRNRWNGVSYDREYDYDEPGLPAVAKSAVPSARDKDLRLVHLDEVLARERAIDVLVQADLAKLAKAVKSNTNPYYTHGAKNRRKPKRTSAAMWTRDAGNATAFVVALIVAALFIWFGIYA